MRFGQGTEEESDQTSGEESAQSTDEESDQAVDDQQPSDGDSEQPTDEEPAQPADEQAGEATEESQPVTVVFNAVPETAVITVYVVENEETVEPIPAEEDGSFALLPGEYIYSASAEGYKAVEAVPFTVEESEEPLTIKIEMEAEETEKAEETEEAEPLPFDQSATVDGVVITVRAKAGAFPNNAELSVKHVYAGRVKQAGEAVDEVRDEDQNVAASYTFDIKVIDPITKEELQPADGYAVEVSFALAEVADENLEANVYHVTQEEATGELTAEKLDTDVDAEGETVTATTEGFSLYTVEFTYNNLEYVLQGDKSVTLSEILARLGLTGEVSAVVVSNENLFDATLENGEYVVTAKLPFSTEEWMYVTINEKTFRVTVTDDQAPIPYLIPGQSGGTAMEYTVINSEYKPKKWTTGWYAVTSNTTIEDRVMVSGTVNLILCGNAALTAEKGINVAPGNTLNIYAQSTGVDMGKLIATGTDQNAGIGGNKGRSCGNITIYGGEVRATGGDDGIGATPGDGGAGIGGGEWDSGDGGGGEITITGGIIEANGGGNGAGIGGGRSNGGYIHITGGTIYISGVNTVINATGDGGGAGIGTGNANSGGDGSITIEGGEITATGSTYGAGIGGGGRSNGGYIHITGGAIIATGGNFGGAGIGGGHIRFHDKNDESKGLGGNGGTIEISGGAKVYAYGGNGGKYENYTYRGAAGIGGGYKGNGDTVTIVNGASVTATGGDDGGAGIGGGCRDAIGGVYYGGDGGTVTISGGTVHANGKDGGAGIGGGNGGDGKKVTISGGAVYAYGGDKGGAGIGGGVNGAGGSIEIAGGDVTATGGYCGAGVGGGNGGDGGTIKISGGDVTAIGDRGGAGIGGGFMGEGGNIEISGGVVTAIGGVYTNDNGTEIAGGIGAGRQYDGEDPTTITLKPKTPGKAPEITASTYIGTLTLTGDFCEKLSGGSYGAVIDKGLVSDGIKDIIRGRTIAPVDGPPMRSNPGSYRTRPTTGLPCRSTACPSRRR